MNPTILILLLLLLPACGSWRASTRKFANYAYVAVDKSKDILQPGYRQFCKTLAQKCVDEGVTTKEECSEWVICEKQITYAEDAMLGLNALAASAHTVAADPDEVEAKSRAAEILSKMSKLIKQLNESIDFIVDKVMKNEL